MVWTTSRFALLLIAVPFTAACAQGSDDPEFATLSGAYSAGPGESGETPGATDGGADTDPVPPVATSSQTSADGTGGSTGTGDDGNPACCQVGGQAGCGSDTTEACVCTSNPACCQAVWSADCVELAIACGDPYCADDPTTGDGESSGGEEPPVELPCDGAFSFSPANPAPGVPFTSTFSDPEGLTFISNTAQDAAGAEVQGQYGGVQQNGQFMWSHDFAGLAAGVWTFSFTWQEQANSPVMVRGTCRKQF